MQVSEIVHVLSGEGIHAGLPTVLVRLTGCNLRCAYCDTEYAFGGGQARSVLDIVTEVCTYKSTDWVLITGGEPLCQLERYYSSGIGLVGELLKSPNRKVEIETNGSIAPPTWFRVVDSWNVDVKCPSSGVCGSFKEGWLALLREQDQLKFVVSTPEDLYFVRDYVRSIRAKGALCKAHLLVSPNMSLTMHLGVAQDEIWYDVRWLQKVAEFCKEQNFRMSLQSHKIVYGNKRGV